MKGKVNVLRLLLLTFCLLSSNANASNLDEWLYSVTASDVVADSKNQIQRRQHLLVDLLDTSGGRAKAVRMTSWSIIGCGNEYVMQKLAFKPYLRRIEKEIKHLSDYEQLEKSASRFLPSGSVLGCIFTTKENGDLETIKVTKSSGSQTFDVMVTEQIKKGFASLSYRNERPSHSISNGHFLCEFYVNGGRLEFAMIPTGEAKLVCLR